MGGAGAYLLFGQDKGLGIFLVLVAAVFARILVLNIGERIDPPVRREPHSSQPPESPGR